MPPNFRVVQGTLNLPKQLLKLNIKLLIYFIDHSQVYIYYYMTKVEIHINGKYNSNGRQIPYFLLKILLYEQVSLFS
jgi:hypothetical protein